MFLCFFVCILVKKDSREVLYVWFFLVVNTSASDCVERLVPEMIYYMSRGMLNSTHSLTHLEQPIQCVTVLTYLTKT